MWTAKQVRDQLPNVVVRIGKKVVTGRVSGRLNAFATVSVTNEGTLHSGSQLFMDKEVAWQTVANCLNNERPVVF